MPAVFRQHFLFLISYFLSLYDLAIRSACALRTNRNAPMLSSAFAVAKKMTESIGHIIRFFNARAGRITMNACPYNTVRHNVFRNTLHTSITINLVASTLGSVSYIQPYITPASIVTSVSCGQNGPVGFKMYLIISSVPEKMPPTVGPNR
jgi:hypothetical protein